MRAVVLSLVVLALIVAVYVYYTATEFSKFQTYISDESWYAPASLNILRYVFHANVTQGFPYPNASGIETYLNPEHPPLAKYLMAISILALGYEPVAWRLPGWILGGAALVAAFLTGRALLREEGDDAAALAGVLSALLLATDPTFWALHGIAMLDAYAGFFALLALYFLVSGRKFASSVALGLAFAAKETTFPLVIPYLYYIGELEERPVKRVAYGLLIPASVYLALSTPLIIYYGGLVQWLQSSFLHMLGWDITSGHIAGGAESQISTPWDWFLNVHPFYLGEGLYARTNVAVMLMWIALTPLPLIRRNAKLATATAFAWAMWAGLLAVYLSGNTTLFSFYVADFSPIVDVYVASAVVFGVVSLEERRRAQGAKRALADQFKTE